MTALKPSVKILTLKLIVFFVVAAGLFWLANIYAPAKNTGSVANGRTAASSLTSTSSLMTASGAAAIASGSPIAHKAYSSFSAKKPLFARISSVQAPILMYHYISIPPATTTLPGLYLDPRIFENQLKEIIKSDYQTVFMSKLSSDIKNAATSSKKLVALTFDDGYEDFYTNAFPLLKKYNLKGTLYVIINAVDKQGYITKAQLKEMAVSGVVEIGSHTFNHPDLRLKKKADQIFEIKGSRNALEAIINIPVLTFAYPYGYYNSQILEITKDSGYLGAVTVMPGVNHKSDNLWLITRLRPGNRSGEEFLKWLGRN